MPCKKATSVKYKDVVVIGNGPSAIALSYMLAGNSPVYSGISNDELLHLRLSEMPGYPIVLQDLRELSEGLEGRSTNTVSLLFDALLHPDADLGINSPSLLEWDNMPDLQIDHVVLGKGQPGGTWKSMDNNLLTVSLGAWMELPNLTLSQWKDVGADYGKRITASLVAEYYQDYIKKMGLGEYFSNDTVVTSVKKVKNCMAYHAAKICHAKCVCRKCVRNANNENTTTMSRNDTQIGTSSCQQTPHIDIKHCDSYPNDSFGQESIFVQELEVDDGYGYPEKGANSTPSDSSTLSDCSDSNPENINCSPPQNLAPSDKNSLPFSRSSNTSGYGVSFTSSELGSSLRSDNVQRFEQSVSMIEDGNPYSHNNFEKSVSMIEDRNPYVHNKRDALSATRMGVYMRKQHRKRANTTCCLEFADDEQLSCCYTTESLQASWNPIVYPPSQLGASWNASASGALISGHVTTERSNSLAYLPTEKWEEVPEIDRYDDETCDVSKCFPEEPYLWEVSGYHYKQEGNNTLKEEFTYYSSNVVMACGQETPNSLDVPGENLPFVLHSLKELEAEMASGKLNSKSDPVIIVGAGLSAADAIIAATEHNLSIVHIFRREAHDRNLIFKNLPPKLYPEYHQVHRMMTQGRHHGKRYQALEKQHLIEIFPDKTVKFHGEATKETLKVSYVLALVGVRPNLEFLDVESSSEEMQVNSNHVGIIKESPVSKNNPVDINIYTFESVHHRGLYAMGPLVGDNFVRFLQGGALAITSHILKKRKRDEDPKLHSEIIR